jgi:lipopolysaccharide transport system ATP-binding protein
MKRLEITQKLEEIIAFSGVERYIDTPVKRYSSGMYVRLAFAVAAHLESEILIIDEVLAVGDAEFQKKCLGKMKDVSQGEGRTVLFVSHNMGTITQLCQNAIILEQGAILAKGGASEVISKHYLNKEITENYEYINTSSKDLFIKRAYSHNVNKNNKSSFFSNEEIFFSITITQKKNQKNLTTSIALLDKFGNRVFTSLKEINDEIQKTENYQVTIKIPSNIIAPNLYSFHFALYYPKGEVYDQINYECPIKVIDAGTNFILYEGLDYGSVIIDCETSITI